MDLFKAHTNSFEELLNHVNVELIEGEYCKKYLVHLLKHKKYYLSIYADLFSKLVDQSGLGHNHITLVDYGAGNGLLGIFAKYCGFKKVWLADIDEKFMQAAQKLASLMSVPIDGSVVGDINNLQSYFTTEKPDAVIGTDVIEHIYDLQYFFDGLRSINPNMFTVFTTGSNPQNFFKSRELTRIHLKDELEGGSPRDHDLFGETVLEPFLKMREIIIKNFDKNLELPSVIKLAKASRGLNKNDIIKAVVKFKTTGYLPVPAHPTNTCNPLSGSWTERLLALREYVSIYSAAGFICKIYPGFYDDYSSGIKNLVKRLLNRIITITGKKISPYIVIVGYKR